MSQPSQLPIRAVVLLVAVSAPIALLFETGVRKLLFVPLVGEDVAEVREFYWPALTDEVREAALTRTAWVLVGVSVLAGALGVALLRRAARREIERNPGEQARSNIRDRMLLLTSIPQVPAIVATLCFSFGSQLGPVLGCMIVSSAFVLAQGVVCERVLARIRRDGPGKSSG